MQHLNHDPDQDNQDDEDSTGHGDVQTDDK